MRTKPHLALVVTLVMAPTPAVFGVTSADFGLGDVTAFRAVPTDDGRYVVCTYRPDGAVENHLSLYEAGILRRIAGPTPLTSQSRIRRAFSLADDGKLYLLCAGAHCYDCVRVLDLTTNDLSVLLPDVSLIDYGLTPRPWIAYAQFQRLVCETGRHDALDADLIPFYAAANEDGPPLLPEMPTGLFVYYADGDRGPLYEASASSSLTAENNPTRTNAPAYVLDGWLNSAWAEGAAGPGTGEWLELAAAVPVRIGRVAVWGGFGENAATMTGNAAPASLEVQLDGKTVGSITPDAGTPYWGEWRAAAPVTVERIRLVITKVKKGAETEDCYISEVVAE